MRSSSKATGVYSRLIFRPELNKIESTYRYFLRSMVWNGHARVNPPRQDPADDSSDETDDVDWSYVINNEKLYSVTGTSNVQDFIEVQQVKWISHVIRRENDNVSKILTFHTTKRTKPGRKSLSVLERAVKYSGTTYSQFLSDSFKKNNNV